jgi:hypothetical protein
LISSHEVWRPGWSKRFDVGKHLGLGILSDELESAAEGRLSGLHSHPKGTYFSGMGKSPRVTFKMLRIAEDDWQVVAECPGTETKYIKGLKSKAEVDEWLTGSRRIDWLRSQGYAK